MTKLEALDLPEQTFENRYIQLSDAGSKPPPSLQERTSRMNQKENDILRCKHDTSMTLAEVLDVVWFGDKAEISFYDHDDFDEYDDDTKKSSYAQPTFTLRMNGDTKVAAFIKPEWVLGTVICIQQCDDGVWRVAIRLWKEDYKNEYIESNGLGEDNDG